jgi:hypothetical protein
MIGGALIVAALMFPVSATADVMFWLDTPQPDATVFGLVQVSGYVLGDGTHCGAPWQWPQCDWGDSSVLSVELYVDGDMVASADLNQPRYDVLLAYPWYAGTPFARPGFATSFDSRDYANGSHSLFVRVSFADGSSSDFGERSVTVNNDLNQAPFGELEMPGPNQPMNGVYPLTGWALDDGEVTLVEVLVDGLSIGHAVTGVHRPDIGHRFPSHPDAARAGFVRMLNTTVFTNGVHSVAIRVTDDDGASRVIGRRFVQTFNTGYNLPPFGQIDEPIPNHIMFAKGCSDPGGYSTPPFQDPQVTELITGWALDVGSRTDLGGVAYVQLLLDGVILEDTYLGSDYWPWLRLDVNYYGHPRMDILRMFPDVPNAKDSGFAFRMDVSDLIIRKGYRQGLHYLKIRAGDLESNVADIAQVPVIFDCDDDPDRPSFGDIYTPVNMELTAGDVEVTGYAIDYDDPQFVEIWVDGVFIAVADEFELPTPEVEDRYPWLPRFMTENAGFRHQLDTTQFTDGEHLLVIWTEDYFGGRTIIGERRFVVTNMLALN